VQELKGGHVIAAQQKQLTRTGPLRLLRALNYTVRVSVYSKVFLLGVQPISTLNSARMSTLNKLFLISEGLQQDQP